MIDVRSDAVTQPTEEMWQAMRSARLGWAHAGEDPSVSELEQAGARLTGMKGALLVPTGTMANLAALMSHTERGDQVVLEADSHILWSEEWGFAHICGLAARPIKGHRGAMDPTEVEDAVTERRFAHRPRTGLICLENTHNIAGGALVDPANTAAIGRVARRQEIPVHMDGSRLPNAAAALGVEIRQLLDGVDSVAISLNKGLSAPMGALLCGPEPFVEQCRTNLKRLGGWSIHQAGIFAAAGLVALRTMGPQLVADHVRAKRLGAALDGLRPELLSCYPVDTNIVMVTTNGALTASVFAQRLNEHGVRVSVCTDRVIRMVTHRHISDDDISRIEAVFRTILRSN